MACSVLTGMTTPENTLCGSRIDSGRLPSTPRGGAVQSVASWVFMLSVFAGGYVDWDIAEARGDVVPIDYVEGLSIPRGKLKIDQDVPLTAKGTFLGNVLFSHKRHVAWNGCEVCHPEIFPSTKHGTVKYTMMEISAGGYCGVCHQKVAFPIADCERCHVKPVR